MNNKIKITFQIAKTMFNKKKIFFIILNIPEIKLFKVKLNTDFKIIYKIKILLCQLFLLFLLL